MTTEIVDFPMKNGGSFQFAMLNYQRVYVVLAVVALFFHDFSYMYIQYIYCIMIIVMMILMISVCYDHCNY